MKKIISLIVCFTTTLSLGQSPKYYYWVGNAKHYIEYDTSKFLIEVNSIDREKAERLKSDPDVKAFRIKDESTHQFVVNGDAKNNFIKRNSLTSIQQVIYPSIHETAANGTAYITDEITIKFKNDSDLKSLSSKYNIKLIKKTSYGAYLFKTSDYNQTLYIANRIKENESVVGAILILFISFT